MSVAAALRAPSRPRSAGLLLVMAAHVALGWLVANGLGLRLTLEAPPEPMQATIIEPARPLVEPRRLEPRSTPDLRPVERIEIPEPDVVLPPDEQPGADPIAAQVAEPGVARVLPEPRREPPSADPRHPLTQPPYPAASIRLAEEGTVTIELRVGADGRVRESRVLRSSGYPRLDAAAVDEARRAWRLQPARVDGTPVEAWHAVRVSFRLDRRQAP